MKVQGRFFYFLEYLVIPFFPCVLDYEPWCSSLGNAKNFVIREIASPIARCW